jgi:GNAT superfamily N-acetyltransferase
MTSSMDIEIGWRAEHKITTQQHLAIQALLQESFPDYPQRSYYKQLPQSRLLAWRGDELVAHLGVEHRVIRDGDEASMRILGVIDLCVAEPARSQGLGRRLLDQFESLARSSGVDATLLFADDPRLYLTAGYETVSNPVRWLMINEHETIGIGERPVEGLMVKMIGDRGWQPGLVDLLGYLF